MPLPFDRPGAMDAELDWLDMGGHGFGPSTGAVAAAHTLFPASAAGFLEDDFNHRISDTLPPPPPGAAFGTSAAYGAGCDGLGMDALGASSVVVTTTAAAATMAATSVDASNSNSYSTSSSVVAPSSTVAPACAITSEQLQPFEDAVLEYIFHRATAGSGFDPFTPRGIGWPAGITERRQFLLTHFASLARQLVYLGHDPASHRFLDYQRAERLEAFLRGALAALGPTPSPEAMFQQVAAHAPEEIVRLLTRTVLADEYLLVNPATQRPRTFALRLHKCICLADKLAAGADIVVEGLDGLDATLDDIYDGLERHLLHNPSVRLMPRGVEPLILIRHNQPRPDLPAAELLLARVPGSPRPYRWRASLSPGTMGIAQHLFDPSREGKGTRLRDLGVFLQTTEVHACLWDGQSHGAC